MPAIRPISVALPVAVTTNVAVPRVTWVFWNTRFGPVAERDLAVGQRARVLGHRRALAGQRGLLHLQRGRGHDPPVRRDHVPGLEQHDVTRHQLGRLDLARPAPARRTRACGTCSFASASTLARAFSSWAEPITTLNVTRPSTTSAVGDLHDREARRDHEQQHDVHRVDQLAPAPPPTCSAAARSPARWARLTQPPLHLARRPARHPGQHPAARVTSQADRAYQGAFSAGCCKVAVWW